jgi:hypothetical protein
MCEFGDMRAIKRRERGKREKTRDLGTERRKKEERNCMWKEYMAAEGEIYTYV